MSLISLASVRALQEDAVAEGRARPSRIPGAADAQERIVGSLIAFSPAESVALFIAALAAVGGETHGWVRWTLFGVIAEITPLWVEIDYLKKVRSRRSRRRTPLFEDVRRPGRVRRLVDVRARHAVDRDRRVYDALGTARRAARGRRAAHRQRAARGAGPGTTPPSPGRSVLTGHVRGLTPDMS